MPKPHIHHLALAEGQQIGPGTRVAAFAYIAANARIGVNCDIGTGVVIETGVTISDRVVIQAGAQLCAGVTVDDDVSIGRNCVLSPNPTPSDPRAAPNEKNIVIRHGASLGAGSMIIAAVEIGRGAVVQPGAVIDQSVPAYAVVGGDPAKIQGYLRTPPIAAQGMSNGTALTDTTELPVKGVHLHRFREFSDLRGKLTVADCPGDGIPFIPRRCFIVHDVPSREARGEHAHRECQQFLICVAGQVSVAVDDGTHRAEVTLADPALGIYIPPLVWASQFRYDTDSVLMVFASHPYDPDDYIREYDSFLTTIGLSR